MSILSELLSRTRDDRRQPRREIPPGLRAMVRPQEKKGASALRGLAPVLALAVLSAAVGFAVVAHLRSLAPSPPPHPPASRAGADGEGATAQGTEGSAAPVPVPAVAEATRKDKEEPPKAAPAREEPGAASHPTAAATAPEKREKGQAAAVSSRPKESPGLVALATPGGMKRLGRSDPAAPPSPLSAEPPPMAALPRPAPWPDTARPVYALSEESAAADEAAAYGDTEAETEEAREEGWEAAAPASPQEAASEGPDLETPEGSGAAHAGLAPLPQTTASTASQPASPAGPGESVDPLEAARPQQADPSIPSEPDTVAPAAPSPEKTLEETVPGGQAQRAATPGGDEEGGWEEAVAAKEGAPSPAGPLPTAASAQQGAGEEGEEEMETEEVKAPLDELEWLKRDSAAADAGPQRPVPVPPSAAAPATDGVEKTPSPAVEAADGPEAAQAGRTAEETEKERLARRAKRLLYEAASLERKGDHAGAVAVYKKVMELDSDDYRLHNKVGSILIKADMLDEALTYIDRSLELRDDYVYALVNKAIVLAKKGRTAEAEAFFKKALKKDDTNAAALMNLALLYERTGLTDRAAELYRKLSSLGIAEGTAGLHRLNPRYSP
ncbi:MAG TPA: tetratricopeptide repeat protein [Deltaproteobacteria bacterium]|nr:tetratricopeptide repeat protein [Deltaproteobacteria bacterium]